MLTLAVTTSTAVVGVAVGRLRTDGAGTQVMQDRHIVTDRRHAEELTVLLAQVSEAAGVQLADVERLVVDVGPGRFTGLRVGLAAVKALAMATGAPVLGLTSLEVLAAGVSPVDPHHQPNANANANAGRRPGREPEHKPDPQSVCAVVDARRGEVFQQCFTQAGPATDPVYGQPQDLAPMAIGLVVGDGADRYADVYRQVPGVTMRPGSAPSAAIMLGRAGEIGVDAPRWQPGRHVAPVYLREPDVAINIKTRPVPPSS